MKKLIHAFYLLIALVVCVSCNIKTQNHFEYISGYVSRYDEEIDLTQNVFSYLPISDTRLENYGDYVRISDSIRCDTSGRIFATINLSFTGQIQADDWRIGVFLNGIEKNSVKINAGNFTENAMCSVDFSVNLYDYISFRITNESADRDPTINDMSFIIIWKYKNIKH